MAKLENTYTIEGIAYSAADMIAKPDVPNEVMSAWLGLTGNDLRRKCDEFIARLAVQETAWDTGLDIVALATGGPAAVAVRPATNTAALAAGSTFATGTRALIDSDVYGKVGANLIASQIVQDFNPALSTYMTNLNLSSMADFESKLDTLLQAQGKCTHAQCPAKFPAERRGSESSASRDCCGQPKGHSALFAGRGR